MTGPVEMAAAVQLLAPESPRVVVAICCHCLHRLNPGETWPSRYYPGDCSQCGHTGADTCLAIVPRGEWEALCQL